MWAATYGGMRPKIREATGRKSVTHWGGITYKAVVKTTSTQ